MNNSSGIAAPIIVDILNKEMQLPANRCWVRDQEVQIPNDKELFIVVGLVSAVNLSNTSSMIQQTVGDPPMDVQVEVNTVQQQENIQIDICSKNNDALVRNWEILAALQSFYAQQQMEANYFKIFRAPRSFVNTSSAEGGSQVNRYSVTIAALVWYRKSKTLTPDGENYYDDFTTRVDDAQTLGTETPLFEFEINQGGILP